MDTSDYHPLLFRRQYLITPFAFKCPFSFNREEINNEYILHYHPDLKFTKVSNHNQSLILLGDIYDYLDPKADNSSILTRLLGNDFLSLVEKTYGFAGRFVLICSERNGIKLFTDAVAQRKIFHTTKENQGFCSSNPHLLAQVLGFEKTANTCWLEYYASYEFEKKFNSNIGYFTLYDEIRQVIPNHYLDLNNNKAIRFWPMKKINKIDDKDIVTLSAQMIKGFMTSAANRYPLMVPVTSGGDSRIILAATRDLTHNVFYYINYMDEIKNKPDMWVPEKLLKKHNREFHVLYTNEQEINEEFKKIFYLNNPFPNVQYLAVIYNYYLNYPEMVNTPGGVMPIIKSLFTSTEKNISGKFLAQLYKVDRFSCASLFYNDWLDEFNNECKASAISLFDLLYWEERTCNWAGQVVQDKDIAQEEFIPFNSHRLITTMLNYTMERRRKPRYELHYELIRNLWPELLEIPFNPSMKSTIKRELLSLGIYEPIYKLRKIVLSLSCRKPA
ncbi:MAG: hypothetical protein JW973_18575 [Bacteroidales bacterium]|nr:hypothetical protein [Bacteroidales bacterium]